MPFRRRSIAPLCLLAVIGYSVTGCSTPRDATTKPAGDSPYLLVSAGDKDGAESDFLAVIDLRPDSKTLGKAIATMPTGLKSSMPHHMEYAMPPVGELLFLNAHHHERSMLVDVSNPLAMRIVRSLTPPPTLRFPHDYTRTPIGTRLVGFLRGDGASVDGTEKASPGNHGGIAEYTANGDLLRFEQAGNWHGKPVRPYAFALLPELDRLVVTSAPMMESAWADVVQVYRYSDFTLLHTIDLPVGRLPNGTLVEGSQRAGFGPRVLPDGSVFFNSYGCAFYRLSDIGGASPRLDHVLTLETPPPAAPDDIRGSCGIPIQFGKYWINPSGKLHAVVVLDISDPLKPREVSRLSTPATFNPHWLARDPNSSRLVLGAELGGEEGYYILRFDETSGQLAFDTTFSADGKPGYVSLTTQSWPHGAGGAAWGHAALFMQGATPGSNGSR